MENRGSVWRKWDLHIHSPLSIKQQYKNTPEGWEKFITALENLPKDVKVIGLTDYYFIDGYEKVMDYKVNKNRLQNLDKIFPILEFRIDTFGTASESKLQKINLHILFDLDETCLSKQIQKVKKEFIEQIPVTKLDKHKTKMLSIENLTNEADGDLHEGFSGLIPSTDRVFELLNGLEWKGKTFLFLGYKEWCNLEKGKQLKPFKEDLYSKVNAFFNNNSETNEKNQTWLNQYGVKRLLHSLDIHGFNALDTYEFDEEGNKIEIKNYHCNTWVKAEPTFEGLKQIIYEPKLRCKIQKENPNNKIPHKCIKSVSFTGHSDFIENKVLFNNDLNTIIGGKSSGKSLLMYYIANTIDYKYAFKQLNPDKKNTEDKLQDKYGFSEQEIFDFEITWNDDVTYRFSERETIKDRKFVYIPQSYILNLTDNIRNKSRKTLGKFIRDILLQDEKSNELYKEFLKVVKELDGLRDNHIDLYFKNEDAVQVFEAEKKEIGDKEGIQNYIKSQNAILQALKKNSNVSDKELNRYNSLNNRLEKINTYSSDLDLELKEIRETIEQYKSSFSNEYDAKDFDYNSAKEFIKRYNQIVFESNKKIDVLDADILKKEALNETRVNGLKQIIEDELKPITSKLKEKTKINAIEDTIKKEKIKLSRVEKIEELINGNHTEKRAKIKNEIIQFYKDAYDEYDKIIEVLNKRGQDFEDINLIGTVKFYHKRYRENLLPFFNKSSIKTKELLNTNLCKDHGNLLPDVLYDNYIKEIESVFDKIVNDELPFTKHREKKDCVKALFKDEFFDYWELRIKNDEMANMSPGKANLVILKLLVELSESDAPILIDQPEDNLDNRSIYRDLVQFLRKRKADRQIIIVSHNPNIVVSADSENVIVANQSDQDEGRDNKDYRFEYINGALENSFKLSGDKKDDIGILKSMGIREHVTDILEGGEEAFLKREEKYGF